MAWLGLPVLFTLLAWWLSTGVILYLDGLPRRTFPATLLGATLLLGLGLVGLAATADDTSLPGAYLAFLAALTVWGWIELTFLTGVLTGPRVTTCPSGCAGWRHFLHAAQAIAWHELAILVAGMAVIALTWGGANPVGSGSFLILWTMRLSAKLNLFLGVRNLNAHLLPDHLAFLASFLRRRPMNLLFPVSITVSTVALVVLVQRAAAADVDPFAATAATFLATLLALAILEHWFLVLPLPAAALWKWGLRSRTERETTPTVHTDHPPARGLAL